MNTLKEFILLLGGWTFIITIIFSFISKIIVNKLTSHWQNIHNKEIEYLKSMYDRDHTLLKSVISNYSSGFEIIQKERIKAIQILWDMVINLRKFTYPQTFFYGVLTELKTELKIDGPNLIKNFNALAKNLDITEVSNSAMQVEKYRPFIGESLWALFITYWGFVNYSYVVLGEAINKNDLKPWQDNEALTDIIIKNFNEEESKVFLTRKMHSFTDTVRAMESKIINQIQKILSGEEDLKNNIEAYNKINDVMNTMNKKEFEKDTELVLNLR